MAGIAVVAAAALVAYCVYFMYRRYQFAKNLNLIPGFPTSTFGIGFRSSITFWQVFASSSTEKVPERMSQFFSSLSTMFPSGIARMWLGPLPVVFLMKPDYIQSFINNNKNETKKARFYQLMRPFIGNGLVTSHGEDYKHQRKMLTPAFHVKILEHAIPVIHKNADALVVALESQMKKSKDGIIDDIAKYILLCSLDIISESAMGQEMNAQQESESEFVKANRVISHAFMCRIVKPWFAVDFIFNNSALGKHFYKYVYGVKDLVDSLIQTKRNIDMNKIKDKDNGNDGDNNNEQPPAFIDILMKFHKDSPEDMTPDHMRDQTMTFMAAGYETTGWTLSWCMYLLSSHPEIQERLQEEIDSEFGDSDELSFDQLKQGLPFTEAVAKETMRLFPTVPGFARELQEDIVIDGHTIPKSTNIAINAVCVHRNPEHWDQPNRFIPDRFLAEKGGNRHHPFAFIPFSAGARNCIGQKFAMIELKLIIAKICRKFTITRVNQGDDVQSFVAIVLAAASDIRVKLEPRVVN